MKRYIAYDERAIHGRTVDAAILCAYANGESLEEIRADVKRLWGGGLVCSYDVGEDGKLVNENRELIVTPTDGGPEVAAT